jgi:hypothetical protein
MSEVFVIEQETLKVKILGEELEFRAPTCTEEEAVSTQFKEYDPESSPVHPNSIYKNFLVNLGIPLEKLDKLSSKNIVALFGYAIGSKKN